MAKKYKSPLFYKMLGIISFFAGLFMPYLMLYHLYPIFPKVSSSLGESTLWWIYIIFFITHIVILYINYKDRYIISASRGLSGASFISMIAIIGYYLYIFSYSWNTDILFDLKPLIFGFISVIIFHSFSSWIVSHEKTNASDSFGKGEILEKKDLEKIGLFDKPKDHVVLGYIENKKKGNKKVYTKNSHITVIGQAGGGKTSAFLIPNLCDRNNGHFILDPKGEMYISLYKQRQNLNKNIRRKTYIFDPLNVIGELLESLKDKGIEDKELEKSYFQDRVTINPLDLLSQIDMETLNGRQEVEKILSKFVDCIVVEDEKKEGSGGSSQHFNQSVNTLLKGTIYYLLDVAPEKSWIEKEQVTLRSIMSFLVGSDDVEPLHLREKIETMIGESISAKKHLINLMNMGTDEFGSLSSTLSRMMDFLTVELILNATDETSLLWRDITDGYADLFFVIPPDQIKSQSRLIQLVIYRLIKEVYDRKPKENRVTFALDEFAQLGYSKIIEDTYPIIRGYGGSFWIFVQNLSQLDRYKDKALFKDSPVTICLGTQDEKTLKELTYMSGEKTVKTESFSGGVSDQSGGNRSQSASQNRSTQESKAAVLTPEILRTELIDKAVVFLLGHQVFFVKKLFHYLDISYKDKLQKNYIEE